MAKEAGKFYKNKSDLIKRLKKEGVAESERGKYIRDAGNQGWEYVVPVTLTLPTCETHPMVTLTFGDLKEVEALTGLKELTGQALVDFMETGVCATCEAEAKLLAESSKAVRAKVDADLDGAAATAKKPKTKKEPKGEKTATVRAPTVSSIMRDLIKQGLDNAAVFAACKTQFPDLDDSKKGYPAWYRAKMKKNGQL